MALALLASPPPPLGGVRRSFGTRCSLFAAQRAKRNLMDLISDQDRGLRTQKDAVKRDAIVNAIEAMAVIGGSSVTTGDSLSATWRLLWTTEKEQLFIIEGGVVRHARWRGTAGDRCEERDAQQRHHFPARRRFLCTLRYRHLFPAESQFQIH
ncbi:unnamed protein product [Brassica napus]|uniref:(rape) hypothetical protein n=1 Tax=Brassica napus TaxID=3708 RepID=A0A816NDH0_BRANA|nr:unnamed protein product [Brassica napus]